MNFVIDHITKLTFLVTALLTAFVAWRKGRNVAGWFVLGFLFSILALAVVALLPTGKQGPDGPGVSGSSSYSRILAFIGKVFSGAFLGFMVIFAANGGAGGSSKMSGFAWAALVIYLVFFLPAVVRWAKQAYKPHA